MNPLINNKEPYKQMAVNEKQVPFVIWNGKIIALLDYHSQIRLYQSCVYFKKLMDKYWEYQCKKKWSASILKPAQTWCQLYGQVSGNALALAARLNKIICSYTLYSSRGLSGWGIVNNQLIIRSEAYREYKGYYKESGSYFQEECNILNLIDNSNKTIIRDCRESATVVDKWLVEKSIDTIIIYSLENDSYITGFRCQNALQIDVLFSGNYILLVEPEKIQIYHLERNVWKKIEFNEPVEKKYLTIVPGKITCVSSTGLIKLWDLNSACWLPNQLNLDNRYQIYSLCSNNDQLLIGLLEKTSETYAAATVNLDLKGPVIYQAFNSKQFSPDTLCCQGTTGIIGSNNSNDILIVNITNFQTITLKGHTAPIQDLRIVGNTLISVSRDRTIKIWDLERREIISTCNYMKIVELKIWENKIILRHTDKTIQIWEPGHNRGFRNCCIL